MCHWPNITEIAAIPCQPDKITFLGKSECLLPPDAAHVTPNGDVFAKNRKISLDLKPVWIDTTAGVQSMNVNLSYCAEVVCDNYQTKLHAKNNVGKKAKLRFFSVHRR